MQIVNIELHYKACLTISGRSLYPSTYHPVFLLSPMPLTVSSNDYGQVICPQN